VRSENVPIANEEHLEPVKSRYAGCPEVHQRASGYCLDHEIIAKKEENSRAQALIQIGTSAYCIELSVHRHLVVNQKWASAREQSLVARPPLTKKVDSHAKQ
jgi:hypothetical protein